MLPLASATSTIRSSAIRSLTSLTQQPTIFLETEVPTSLAQYSFLQVFPKHRTFSTAVQVEEQDTTTSASSEKKKKPKRRRTLETKNPIIVTERAAERINQLLAGENAEGAIGIILGVKRRKFFCFFFLRTWHGGYIPLSTVSPDPPPSPFLHCLNLGTLPFVTINPWDLPFSFLCFSD